MDIINIELENWYSLSIKLNYFAIILLFVILFGVSIIVKKILPLLHKNSMYIDEVELGIGTNSKVKIKFSREDREIAYKLWVEMSTRKIILPFDEENDVIVEVYDSWYSFFGIARGLLKDIPVEKLNSSKQLISVTDRVLNKCLRPHLTKWQARFRKWYNLQLDSNSDLTPQEIQYTYPHYNELIKELKAINKNIDYYGEILKKLAFKE